MEVKKTLGRRYTEKNKPIKLILDIDTLDILCKYVISDSGFVRSNNLSNLRNLIKIIDKSTYENDPEKKKRIEFIDKGLDARIDKHLNDKTMIMTYVKGALGYDIDFVDVNNIDLNKNETEWVQELVSETLKYQFIYNDIDDIQDLCTRFNASDYAHRGEIVQEFEKKIDGLKNEFRRVNVENETTDMMFSLREGVFENAITDTYNMVTNPSRRLICGMQGLNDMVGGGFEAGRVYGLFGLGGIGKSLTLLNLLLQFKKYNKYYKTKDPTKTPCVVLLTMENTVVETITRMFDISDPGHSMLDYGSVDEVLQILRTQGQLYVSDDSPIDLVIKYKANKSVDTSYLYTLYDDLEDDGYEVICMIQDHIKRIRSTYNSPDLRIELGDIVNEMKVFAAEKDIPFITVSHLNRDAAKMTEGSASGAPADVTRKLGKANVGESLLMVDNLDCGIVMNLEFDQDGNRFMCYNLIKMRDKVSLTYIAQPFEYGSTIKLREDVGGPPVYKTTLKEDGGNTKVYRQSRSVRSADPVSKEEATKSDWFDDDDMKNNLWSDRSEIMNMGSDDEESDRDWDAEDSSENSSNNVADSINEILSNKKVVTNPIYTKEGFTTDYKKTLYYRKLHGEIVDEEGEQS